jgi:DNA polymerase III subunit epsilon
MRQVFLDTETTGLNVEGGDRILEVGCIELVNRRDSGRTLHHYVNPQRASHPDALKVHGITEEFLADKPLFADVAAALVEFCAGAEVIIHNAAFDCGFIDAELARLKLPPLASCAARITDSLLLARELYPGKSNSLDALCKRLEVDNRHRDRHGALLDAGLLAQVYLNMTRGQGSLVIDAGADKNGALHDDGADLAAYDLVLLVAAPDEVAAHEALLLGIDKESRGKTVWRPVPQPA